MTATSCKRPASPIYFKVSVGIADAGHTDIWECPDCDLTKNVCPACWKAGYRGVRCACTYLEALA